MTATSPQDPPAVPCGGEPRIFVRRPDQSVTIFRAGTPCPACGQVHTIVLDLQYDDPALRRTPR
jgi:hypothetical protein